MKITKSQLREIIREEIKRIDFIDENLMGMKRKLIHSFDGNERYIYTIKGREHTITIDVDRDSRQGFPGSNQLSIYTNRGWLANTPKFFKKIEELEKFIKKIHPKLVKISNGELELKTVSFPK